MSGRRGSCMLQTCNIEGDTLRLHSLADEGPTERTGGLLTFFAGANAGPLVGGCRWRPFDRLRDRLLVFDDHAAGVDARGLELHDQVFALH